MIDRSKYRKLRKVVKAELQRQAGQSFIAVTKGLAETMSGLSSHEVEKAWPHLVKDLGLVDDLTGYDTWTLPGCGINDAYSDVPTKEELRRRW